MFRPFPSILQVVPVNGTVSPNRRPRPDALPNVRKLVSLRQKAGLTQEQVAEKLRTNKSNISRLESVNSTISPKLSTIADYAEAIGYDIKINFVAKKKRQHKKDLLRVTQKRSR